jgi:hypothetical protein
MTWEASMRKYVIGALASLVVGGVGTGVLVASAQPAPPPAGFDGPPPSGPPHRMDWMMRGQRGHEMREHGPAAPGTFALIHRQQDRQLSPADVQKIAEAFLLWNGNHNWKVIDVAPAADGTVAFAIATPEGSVIARFTMDPHSGRVTRTG